MINAIRNALLRVRYGEPVYVISGLPRSGTSMLMNMLVAGGLSAVTDAERSPDEDNPLGYFEHERIKDLETESDKSWLRNSRGRAIKVISHLLRELPQDNRYLIVFARRDLREVLASQNKMLERRGEENPIADDKALEHYRKHLVNIRVLTRRSRNIKLLEVNYREAVEDPRGTAERIRGFLGVPLDVGRMADVVDSRLYRNRSA